MLMLVVHTVVSTTKWDLTVLVYNVTPVGLCKHTCKISVTTVCCSLSFPNQHSERFTGK